ncbi:SLC4A8, partial [Symbiodinium necroappetens]
VMLNEALDSLKAFYVEKPKAKKSLLQKPSEDTVPEGFKDYQKSSSGNAVTQLLQQVILDTKAMEAETTRAMKSSEKQFAKLTDATNADIAALNGELESLAKAKASAQEAVVAEKANLKGTKKELADLALDEANLHE